MTHNVAPGGLASGNFRYCGLNGPNDDAWRFDYVVALAMEPDDIDLGKILCAASRRDVSHGGKFVTKVRTTIRVNARRSSGYM